MPCRRTIQHAAATHSYYHSVGKPNSHRAIRRPNGINIDLCRYVSTSTPSQSASEDHAPSQNSIPIRKINAWPQVDRKDIFVNSLAATVEAHRWRGQQRSGVPTSSASPIPSIVRKVGEARRDPFRSRGERHWASFEDFQAQFKPGDEEWERRLGQRVGSNGPFVTTNTESTATTTGTGDPERSALDHLDEEDTLPKSNHHNIPAKIRTKDHSAGRTQGIKPLYRQRRTLPRSLLEVQVYYANHGSADELLSGLIVALERYLYIGTSDYAGIDQVLTRTYTVIESILPDRRMLQLHGSYATDLASPLSDIDMNISLPENPDDWIHRGPSPERLQIRRRRLKVLRDVQEVLQAHSPSLRIKMIQAQYPLLVIKDPTTELVYQISCGRKVGATTATVRALLDEYPTLRSLYTLLRHTLLIRGLNDASTGGVGSYTLLIMILAALKHSKSLLAGDSLGQQLLAVLDFWKTADLGDLGYTAVPPLTFPKYGACAPSTAAKTNLDALRTSSAHMSATASNELGMETDDPVDAGIAYLQAQNHAIKHKAQTVQGYLHHPSQLCLQDPASPSNDLGLPIYRMPSVIKTLGKVTRELRRAMQIWDNTPSEHRHDPKLNVLRPLVASNFAFVQTRRIALREAAGTAEQRPAEIPESGVEMA